MVPRRQRPDHSRNAHLPLSRPLDVGPGEYRSKEEVDKVRTEHDPIEQVRSRLLKKGFATEDALKKVDAAVRAVVNEASEFATHDAEPDPSELYTDMYVEHGCVRIHRRRSGIRGCARRMGRGRVALCPHAAHARGRAGTPRLARDRRLAVRHRAPRGRRRRAGRYRQQGAGRRHRLPDVAFAATSVATNLARVSR